MSLIFFGIGTTLLVEAVTGFGFSYLFHYKLWDYRDAFQVCHLAYICLLPSSMFGLVSVYTVVYIQPLIKPYLDRTPRWLASLLLILFLINIGITITQYFA